MKHFKIISALCFSLFVSVSAFSQSPFLNLSIVEASNFNKIMGTLDYSDSTKSYVVYSERMAKKSDTVTECTSHISGIATIHNALVYFLEILEPEKSYVIQHDNGSYYFVFQYDPKEKRYLVMNNSIGEKNDAIYRDNFHDAYNEMFALLKVFYNL